jgi:hypothetical protein
MFCKNACVNQHFSAFLPWLYSRFKIITQQVIKHITRKHLSVREIIVKGSSLSELSCQIKGYHRA